MSKNKVLYCDKCFAELDTNNDCKECEPMEPKFPKSKEKSKCFETPDYKEMFHPSKEGKTWMRVKSLYLILLMAISFSFTEVKAESFFQLKSTLSYLPEAIQIADLVMKDEDFQNEVRAITSFKDSKENGHQVVITMLSPKKATVSTYKTFNPYSKTTAYTTGGAVYFNRWSNPRPMKEMVNTLVHERLHVLKYYHYGNSWKGNENTVPYKVGAIAERYVFKYQN